MLFRFSLAGGKNFRSYLLKFQPVSTITTSSGTSDNAGKPSDPSSSNHPPEYPLPTSKRDFVNFPRPIVKESSPPTRLGFLPESWFQFMYPKTGYTGPYVFYSVVLIYLLSKERIVVEKDLKQVVAVTLLFFIIQTKFGDKIAAMWNKHYKEFCEEINGGQEKEKQMVRNDIEYMENLKEAKSAVIEVTKAVTETVHMQMEFAFRERLLEVYKKVKNQLDCQAELENAERRITQKNLMDYVLRNVMKSITPELEKSAMQLCIKDLNDLATKV